MDPDFSAISIKQENLGLSSSKMLKNRQTRLLANLDCGDFMSSDFITSTANLLESQQNEKSRPTKPLSPNAPEFVPSYLRSNSVGEIGLNGNQSQKIAQKCPNSGQKEKSLPAKNASSIVVNKVIKTAKCKLNAGDTKDAIKTHTIKTSSSKVEALQGILANRKVLVILRGPPGCGKSTLAKNLKGKNGVVCNTDEYFLNDDNVYNFNPGKLEDAHTWNQQNAIRAMENRVTPVIIDNTNAQIWEMVPYVRAGKRHHYDIHFLIPDNPWTFNAAVCAKRNQHGISRDKIEQFIQNFNRNVNLNSFFNNSQLKRPVLQRVQSADQSAVADSIKKSLDYNSQEIFEEKLAITLNSECVNAWESADQENIWGSQPNFSSQIAQLTYNASGLIEQSFEISFENCQNVKNWPSNDGKNGQKSENFDNLSTNFESPKEKSENSPAISIKENGKTGQSRDHTGKSRDLQQKSITNRNLTGLFRTINVDSDMITLNNWSLTNDLICGSSNLHKISADNQSLEVSQTQLRIELCDQECQVNEQLIALSYHVKRRSLTKEEISTNINNNGDRNNAQEALKPPPFVSYRFVLPDAAKILDVLRCDKGSQTELTGLENNQQDFYWEDGEKQQNKQQQAVFEMLKCCFPAVPLEDLDHVLKNCDNDAEWATNVLLDSGYEINWALISENNSCRTNTNEKINENSDEKLSDVELIDSGNHTCPGSSSWSAENEEQAHPQAQVEEKVDDSSPSRDDPCCCIIELSVDMASQLQQIFGRVQDDIPADLLNPMQLKVALPLDLAGQLYQCWLKTQTSDKFLRSCDENEEVYAFDDELLAEDKIKQTKLAIQQQTLRDEQYARQILDEEQKLFNQSMAAHSKNLEASKLSTKLKFQMLTDMFHDVDKVALKELFKANQYNIEPTIDLLCETLNLPQKPTISAGPSQQPSKSTAFPQAENVACDLEVDSPDSGDIMLGYEELRERALHHYNQRKEYFDKAQTAFHKKMYSVASYYAQMGRVHDSKFKDANHKAAQKLLNHRKKHDPQDTLDLHGLHVQEAIVALSNKLKEYENRPGKILNVVTGSGKHSFLGAKIKPAVMTFLSRRQYKFCELNQGMLQVTMK